jgi:hypothetical protein
MPTLRGFSYARGLGLFDPTVGGLAFRPTLGGFAYVRGLGLFDPTVGDLAFRPTLGDFAYARGLSLSTHARGLRLHSRA